MLLFFFFLSLSAFGTQCKRQAPFPGPELGARINAYLHPTLPIISSSSVAKATHACLRVLLMPLYVGAWLEKKKKKA